MFIYLIKNIMKKLISSLIISILFTTQLPIKTQAQQTCEFFVNAPPSNVRNGPSKQAVVEGLITITSTVNPVSVYGDWVKIDYPISGWIHASQLQRRCYNNHNSYTSGYCISKGNVVPDYNCY